MTPQLVTFSAFCGTKKVHSHVHNSPRILPVPSQLNAMHTVPCSFFETHFNVILKSTRTSSKPSPSFRFYRQKSVSISRLSHAWRTFRPIRPWWFDSSNNVQFLAPSVSTCFPSALRHPLSLMWMRRFDPKLVCMEFVVDDVVLRCKGFALSLRFNRCSILFHASPMLCNLSIWQRRKITPHPRLSQLE